MDGAWLDLVRVARDLGEASSLFPPGITRLIDLPFTIHDAIVYALGFLSFEKLAEEERPPKSIWLNDEKMEKWWAEVERMREARMKGEDYAAPTIEDITGGGDRVLDSIIVRA